MTKTAEKLDFWPIYVCPAQHLLPRSFNCLTLYFKEILHTWIVEMELVEDIVADGVLEKHPADGMEAQAESLLSIGNQSPMLAAREKTY